MIDRQPDGSRLRWNYTKRITETAPEKITRSKARRLRRQKVQEGRQRKDLERKAERAKTDSKLMDDPADIPLIEQACIGGWGLGDKIRHKVTTKLVGHLDSPDPKTSIAAARAIIRIDERQQEALKEIERKNGGGGGPWPDEILPELIENGVDVLDAIAAATAHGGCDPGDLRQDGESGAMADVVAPHDPGSGGHGHAEGEGWGPSTAGDDAATDGEK